MKIYMDVCCLNRPFDDQSQDRVHLEAESILSILPHCQNGQWQLVTSDMIDYELSRLTNRTKYLKVRGICSLAADRITVTQKVKELSNKFQQYGIKLLDSLHLALCDAYAIDVFLTTDDKLIRNAAKLNLKTKVVNPIEWLMEVYRNEQ